MWKSNLSNIEINFFRATLGTVLLYGSNAWTLTQALSKKLGGTYTKMVSVVKNITWQQHIGNEALYGVPPEITIKKKTLEMKFCIDYQKSQ